MTMKMMEQLKLMMMAEMMTMMTKRMMAKMMKPLLPVEVKLPERTEDSRLTGIIARLEPSYRVAVAETVERPGIVDCKCFGCCSDIAGLVVGTVVVAVVAHVAEPEHSCWLLPVVGRIA